MYGCESWTLIKAECQRIDTLKLLCREDFWESLELQGDQASQILKEINPEYSLERLMPSWSSSSLATWCEERTYWERPWCWERVKAGGRQKDRESWHAAVHGVTKIQTWLSNWTTTTMRRQHRWGRMVSAAYLSTKDILIDLKMVSKKRCSNCNSWNLWQLSYLEKKDTDVAKLRILI